MKKIVVFNLILTVIFPAYCFAEPFQSFPTKREIREDILSIIEDGLAKQEEIISYLEEVSADGIITAGDECLKYYLNIFLIVIGLCQLDFSGGPLEILVDLTILGFGIYWIYINLIVGYECIRT